MKKDVKYNEIIIIPDNIKSIKEILFIKEPFKKAKFDIRNEKGYNKLMKYLKEKEYPLGYSFIFYKLYGEDHEVFFTIDGGYCKLTNEENYTMLLYRIPTHTQEDVAKYIRKTASLIKQSISKLNSLHVGDDDKDVFIEYRHILSNMYYACLPNITLYSDCLVVDKSMLKNNNIKEA